MTTLAAIDVSLARGRTRVLDGVSVAAAAGELVCVAGPNGAGKSTLLAALAGDLAPDAGGVAIDGRAIGSIRTAELARLRAVLPQQHRVAFGFTAGDVIDMGRAPHLHAGSRSRAGRGRHVNRDVGRDVDGDPHVDRDVDRDVERDVDRDPHVDRDVERGVDPDPDAASHRDRDIVGSVVARLDVAGVLDRPFRVLSGGEQARVSLARVLVQDTPILLLDEPTAALDLRHQELVMAIARQQADDGRTVVVVVHDLNLAAAYADRITVLTAGRVLADGSPADVLDPSMLEAAYGIAVTVTDHPTRNCPLVLTAGGTGPWH